MTSKPAVHHWLPLTAVALVCILICAKSINAPPLFDEQFLLAWAHAKHNVTANAGFLSCRGISSLDVWGPLTPLSIQISQFLSFGQPLLWRLHNLLIFAAGSVALFFALRRMIANPIIRTVLTCSAAFALSLIEPIVWLGARGLLLGYCFVCLGLMCAYRITDRRLLIWVTLGSLCYAFALASCLSAWFAAVFFGAGQGIIWLQRRRQANFSANGTLILVSALVPIVIAACGLAALGFRELIPQFRMLHMQPRQASFANMTRRSFKKNRLAVVCDMPRQLGLSPLFCSDGAIVYDGQNSAIASNKISGGILKDALKQNTYSVSCYRWDNNHRQYSPMFMSWEHQSNPETFDAERLSAIWEPPVQFVKTVSSSANEITVRSELPTTGPVMRINGRWLNPMQADFIWVEAKIDAPSQTASSVGLYWTTALLPEYNLDLRHEFCNAVTNDGRYHKYYFPIRSTNWYSSGQPQQLTFGFPAQSTAHIRALGTSTIESRTPQLQVALPESSARATLPPCLGFPNLPQLGLYVLPFNCAKIPITYNLQNTPEAAGILFEISLPNRDFENANGTKLSGVTLKRIPVMGHGPAATLSVEDFPESGIYSIRGITMDAAHEVLGNFSDTLYVLVQKTNSLGWSTR